MAEQVDMLELLKTKQAEGKCESLGTLDKPAKRTDVWMIEVELSCIMLQHSRGIL